MLIDLRLGIAKEHITGLWWVVRETQSTWPDEAVKKLSGPFKDKAAATAGLDEYNRSKNGWR